MTRSSWQGNHPPQAGKRKPALCSPRMIALVYAHPYPDRSRANRILIEAVRELPGVDHSHRAEYRSARGRQILFYWE